MPFHYLKSGRNKVSMGPGLKVNCRFKMSTSVVAYKSFNCFKKLKFNKKNRSFNRNRLKIVFSATKKRKPQKKIPMTYLFVPLKNWGNLYFEKD